MSKLEYLKSIGEEIINLKARSLYREVGVREALIDFTSNDYLGLSELMEPISGAVILGSSASRVLSGTKDAHLLLEDNLEEHFAVNSALFFGSGYLANVGTLSALIGRNDVVFSDKFCHRSLLDGIYLSGAKHKRYKHNNLSHLEDLLRTASKTRSSAQQFFVITESVFSMDGDLAPLREIAELVKLYNALLIVDEAHAIGVFGELGRGRCFMEGVMPDTLAVLGTASKSFCSYGGFFLGSKVVKEYLINKAPTFIFSTALPPFVCESLRNNLKIISANSDLGKTALDNASFFRKELASSGAYDFCTLNFDSRSHIVPLILGSEEKALRLQQKLSLEGILIAVIRPPTVPPGTSRIRFSIRANHEKEDLRKVAYLVADTLKDL